MSSVKTRHDRTRSTYHRARLADLFATALTLIRADKRDESQIRRLQRALQLFAENRLGEVARDTTKAPLDYKKILSSSIKELGLSGLALNPLRNDNINTIGELVTKKEVDLLRTPGLGRITLDEIREALAPYDLELGSWTEEQVVATIGIPFVEEEPIN